MIECSFMLGFSNNYLGLDYFTVYLTGLEQNQHQNGPAVHDGYVPLPGQKYWAQSEWYKTWELKRKSPTNLLISSTVYTVYRFPIVQNGIV